MKNRRLFWRLVNEIEISINRGDFPVGSRLPPERELAERFGVSRPTVREAIIALEVREKVEVKTGSGVYVLDSTKHNLKNKNINAFELTQARALIEGEVAALAAINITDEQLEALKNTLIMMENGESVEKADQLFHQIISDATKNGAMVASVEQLWQLRTSTAAIIDDYSIVCNSGIDKTIAEHRAVYEALKARDSAGARIAMHQHFNRLINTLFDTIETKALEEIRRKNSEKRGLYSIDNLLKIKN